MIESLCKDRENNYVYQNLTAFNPSSEIITFYRKENSSKTCRIWKAKDQKKRKEKNKACKKKISAPIEFSDSIEPRYSLEHPRALILLRELIQKFSKRLMKKIEEEKSSLASWLLSNNLFPLLYFFIILSNIIVLFV